MNTAKKPPKQLEVTERESYQGQTALANPWSAYEGDYSDDSLVHFGLSIRQDWLDKANDYLLPHALGRLARDCKDKKIQDLWQHIEGLLPGEGRCVDE